jgi:hypothetical protein
MACCMWIQNTASCAVTVSPLDHFQPFIVIVTVRPVVDRRVGQAERGIQRRARPLPNQYSGRYIRYWNSSMLTVLL